MTTTVSGAETLLDTPAGRFAAIDYGGTGPDCLLIHGTGQNAAAWSAFAAALGPSYRLAAFDLRGHGQTPETSTEPDQYWRDIRSVAETMGMSKPVLIGHSTGAYVAMAHVAAGGAARAVICIDGFTLESPDQQPSTAAWIANRTMLFDLFRYGWTATAAERDTYIEQYIRAAPDDPFNAGVEPALLRAMLSRCFVQHQGDWVRRPTMAEIETVSSPDQDARIAPNRVIYDEVDVPMLLVWAKHGLSADRFSEISAIASAAANRSLVEIDATHNVPMQWPNELGRVVHDFLKTLAQDG